jgi:hypothetical protein
VIGVRAAPLLRVLPAWFAHLAPSRLVPVAVLIAVVVLGVASLDTPARVFRSPDEHASYLFTRTFAETGKLWYTSDDIRNDEENLLHPRGGVTYQDKVVPFNYLGLPVIYAPVYRVVGDATQYIAIPFALVTVWALASAGTIFARGRRWLPWLVALSATPVLYYLQRPYLNTLPALAFLSVATYLLLLYYHSRADENRVLLIAGSAALGLAAFMRYELIVFEGLFMVVFLLQKHDAYLEPVLRDLGAFLAAVAVTFLLPLVVLNTLTYGSPVTYGYAIFNREFYPERVEASGLVSSLINLPRAVLLPAYPFDLQLALSSFVFQVAGVAQLLALSAAFGLVTLVRRRALPTGYLLAYGALVVYMFLYRGAGYSWLADSTTPNLEASVVRYSLPVYIVFYLLAVYGLARLPLVPVTAVIVVAFAVIGVRGAWQDVAGSLEHVRSQVRASDELVHEEIVPNTEPSAVVYTDIFDKIIGPHREVAGWWGGVLGTHEGFFKPDEVAQSMSRLYGHRPVYLYVSEEEFVVPRLNDALARWYLEATPTDVKRLYRIKITAEAAPTPAAPPPAAAPQPAEASP